MNNFLGVGLKKKLVGESNIFYCFIWRSITIFLFKGVQYIFFLWGGSNCFIYLFFFSGPKNFLLEGGKNIFFKGGGQFFSGLNFFLCRN